jgi:transposase
MTTAHIGIDISKAKFDAALLSAEGKYKHKKFDNTPDGFAAFVAWLLTFGNDKPLIGMEATGAYSIPLADFLAGEGYTVSVVNPAKIHAFARSELSRAKTDKADAKLIARFMREKNPPPWNPPPANIRELQAMLRRVEDLLEMQQMERNRLDTAEPSITDSLKAILDTLEKELETVRKRIKSHINNDPDLKRRRDLLESIPGIGPATSAWLLTLLSPHYGFTNAKQAAAFAGLAPKLQESGKWTGKTTLSKTGDPGLRKALYMPILSAWQHNPTIRAFCQRLEARGKNGMATACAAMRKMVHIAFAILKSGKPFDPEFKLAKEAA